MKLRKHQEKSQGAGWRLIGLVLTLALVAVWVVRAQGVSTTTVQGTVYLANGQAGSGKLEISWPAFTTALNQAVAAGRMSVAIGVDGFVSVRLTPNAGATPAGLYYTAVYHMSDGTANTEYWVVPAGAQAALAQVRAQVMPAAQAVQAVSKTYVDQAVAAVQGSQINVTGGTMTGPLILSGDPTQSLQAATKHYVDTQVATAVPLAGGAMSGSLSTPAVNGVQSPAAGSSQTTLQAAVNAAGVNGAVAIPPSYAGTDKFTNANGVRVVDLRTSGAQVSARNVKEFGAVCDGTIDDTNALQAAIDYAYAHGVALELPQGTCKTHRLLWHGESIGGMGRQVSALKGYAGEDVLASVSDSAANLTHTHLHDFAIYVDVSLDVSCSPAGGRRSAGSCAVNRPVASDSIFSAGGNGLTGTKGTGAAWWLGNCAVAMPAVSGNGGNGLQVASIENLEIAATGVDPLSAYVGASSTHTCGFYLAQWPVQSEFRNIEIKGLNTGIAMPALPGVAPSGLSADTNRWQQLRLETAHGFAAAAGSHNVLDHVVVHAENSAATGEAPTGVIVDLSSIEHGWSMRDAVVEAKRRVVTPQLTVIASGGAVTSVSVGGEHGLGYEAYGTTAPIRFSEGCTAQANATVNSDGSIGSISVTQGGSGCSGTTTANVNVDGAWAAATAVNLVTGTSANVQGGQWLSGPGGYTVWQALNSQSAGVNWGGGGTAWNGSSYPGLMASTGLGVTNPVDAFTGADFGTKLQACVDSLSATQGGTCDARNFTGVLQMSADVRIGKSNVSVLMPCATIETSHQMVITAGSRNVSLRGCGYRGGSDADGSVGGTAIRYTGSGAAIQVGDATYAVNTPGFQLENMVVNTTSSSSAGAQGLAAYRAQELNVTSVYFLGNANQTGMTLDGTGNYTGGTFVDDTFGGYARSVRGIGHQAANGATTDWLNASTFVRLHINCPTSNGSPVAGTVGIDLVQGDGNTITGGDVEGCATALHLGEGAKNNTIVGLRNENSTSQVVADAGSSYNSWITGGTMFTGKLTDNGARNSFLDTFHRSFNGMNGDWYGSQQDATVTNHYRLGTGTGNERGLMDRYQTDYGYRWLMGLSDAVDGEQFYQIKDELNNVNRVSIGQYNAGQSSTNNQTVINAAGTGAVVLNGSANAGTGGLVVSSGGTTPTTVATISSAGNAQFVGGLQVGGTTTFTGSTTVRNNADAEIDQFMWAGATTNQKESLIYKDYTGVSQWYLVKDASNNWALNSAVGGLDSLKAYQSTNSGDTYLNAAKSTGVVRVNYETGSGTAFNVYGGNSSTLYASFAGTNAIKFPGIKSLSGYSCLQIDSSGWISNIGAACGSATGGSGIVAGGMIGQIAYYGDTGNQVTGISQVPVSAGGTGASTADGALSNLGALPLSGGTLTGTLVAPSFAGTGAAPQFNGTATHALNLPADFAAQSASSSQAGSFTTVAAGTTLLGLPGAGGDGVTNDTAAWQSAVNSGARVIDGLGKTYALGGCSSSTCVPVSITASNLEIRNAKFVVNRLSDSDSDVVMPGQTKRGTITGYTVSGGVAVFTVETMTEAFKVSAARTVTVSGLIADTCLNTTFTLTGATTTGFTAHTSCSDVSATVDGGTASQLIVHTGDSTLQNNYAFYINGDISQTDVRFSNVSFSGTGTWGGVYSPALYNAALYAATGYGYQLDTTFWGAGNGYTWTVDETLYTNTRERFKFENVVFDAPYIEALNLTNTQADLKNIRVLNGKNMRNLSNIYVRGTNNVHFDNMDFVNSWGKALASTYVDNATYSNINSENSVTDLGVSSATLAFYVGYMDRNITVSNVNARSTASPGGCVSNSTVVACELFGKVSYGAQNVAISNSSYTGSGYLMLQGSRNVNVSNVAITTTGDHALYVDYGTQSTPIIYGYGIKWDGGKLDCSATTLKPACVEIAAQEATISHAKIAGNVYAHLGGSLNFWNNDVNFTTAYTSVAQSAIKINTSGTLTSAVKLTGNRIVSQFSSGEYLIHADGAGNCSGSNCPGDFEITENALGVTDAVSTRIEGYSTGSVHYWGNTILTAPPVGWGEVLASYDSVTLSDIVTRSTLATHSYVSSAVSAAIQVGMFFGSSTQYAAGATEYYQPNGSNATTTPVSNSSPMPKASMLNSMYCSVDTDPGPGKTVVCTVIVNSAASALTCTITGNGSSGLSCEDTAHTVSVTRGDLVSLKAVIGAGSNSVRIHGSLLY